MTQNCLCLGELIDCTDSVTLAMSVFLGSHAFEARLSFGLSSVPHVVLIRSC